MCETMQIAVNSVLNWSVFSIIYKTSAYLETLSVNIRLSKLLTNLSNKNFTDALQTKNKQLLSNGKNSAEKFCTAIYTLS